MWGKERGGTNRGYGVPPGGTHEKEGVDGLLPPWWFRLFCPSFHFSVSLFGSCIVRHLRRFRDRCDPWSDRREIRKLTFRLRDDGERGKREAHGDGLEAALGK